MQGEDSVTYRSVADITDVQVRFIQDKVDTMEKVFRFCVRQHGQKLAVGTREILAEEDEVQPNGRVFKKVTSLLRKVSIFCIKMCLKFILLTSFLWETTSGVHSLKWILKLKVLAVV